MSPKLTTPSSPPPNCDGGGGGSVVTGRGRSVSMISCMHSTRSARCTTYASSCRIWIACDVAVSASCAFSNFRRCRQRFADSLFWRFRINRRSSGGAPRTDVGKQSQSVIVRCGVVGSVFVEVCVELGVLVVPRVVVLCGSGGVILACL